MNNLFDKVFSVDEVKVSALILIFLISSFFGLTMYVLDGDISDNLLTFMSTLIYAIAGINAFNMAKEAISGFNKSKKEGDNDIPI
ncbi:hypothetical protein [Chengkuizengella marina]|uniref:Uncharacterized protein n=1 Tax=Chengkuizengella marina TaxID=2507566 RepID=A0A6N9Q0V8_9BACL|nr:hypothetical protein [Chengkuizengella marina]NBI28575.1 hypothetical protein [Chengkuizengella marina]